MRAGRVGAGDDRRRPTRRRDRPATGSTCISGASNTSWPRARSAAAVRAPSACGRVTTTRIQSKKSRAGVLLAARGRHRRRSSPHPRSAPATAVSCAALPSGFTIRPRKCSTPPDSVAWPAIGVRHEPSSTARKARSQATAIGGIGVIDARQHVARAAVVVARFDADGALRRPPAGILRRDMICGRVRLQPEPLQPGEREHRGVGLALRRACAAASRHCRAAARRADRAACAWRSPAAAATRCRPSRRAAARRAMRPCG